MPSTRFDARSSGGAPNRPVLGFPGRNVYEVNGSQYALMNGTRQPTELGWWLLRHMAAHDPPLKQAALAKAMEVGQTTVSRWIHEDLQPTASLLIRAADILGGSRREILQAAGYGDDVVTAIDEPTPDQDHPLVARLRRVLGPDGPRNPADRAALEATLEVILDGILRPWEQDATPPTRRRRTG